MAKGKKKAHEERPRKRLVFNEEEEANVGWSSANFLKKGKSPTRLKKVVCTSEEEKHSSASGERASTKDNGVAEGGESPCIDHNRETGLAQ